MFKKYSIRKQFILTFALVILSSIFAVVITVSTLFIAINSRILKAANYYEKMIPTIEEHIRENNVKLLNGNAAKELNGLIPTEGIQYKVIDLYNNSSYGTLEENQESKEALINKLNTVDTDSKNNVKKYIPILNDVGELKGIVILKYALKITSDNVPRWVISLISITSVVSPFVFIILFSYLFGLKLARNINEPLNKLKLASKKIEERDLDFNLEYPFENELGEVIGSFNEMKDALKETLDKQWAMEEDRKEIISSLSHDLRSPLTVIKGKVELLLEGSYKNEERALYYLESINKSTARAITLVEDLNTINKLENPEFNINPSENNILQFLNEKVESLKALGAEKAINIKLKATEITKDDTWYFDGGAISRVLDNIIANSVRYTEISGIIDIVVRIERDRLNFNISDSGRGFSDSDLKLALNKFYRGDVARNINSGNSGLGLYISNIIIQKHKGEINIFNNTNGGATVEFFIYRL